LGGRDRDRAGIIGGYKNAIESYERLLIAKEGQRRLSMAERGAPTAIHITTNLAIVSVIKKQVLNTCLFL
jgi:hypothetical protein